MIRNNKYSIVILIALITISIAHAQNITTNDVTKTKILDWSIDPITLKYDHGIIKSSYYKESKKCGNISFGFARLINFRNFNLILTQKLPHDDRVDFLSDGIKIDIDCKTQVNLNTDNIRFNDVTKQWELSKEDQEDYIEGTKLKSDQLYQLHTPNAFGWVHTIISFDVMGGSYTKFAHFCLFNDKKTKQLCGSGNPQYIPNKKQLGTTRFDYTPILIKILNTAQFLDDK
ncbi:hypothetical protein [Commensalibacter oyaizuii]|uniref:Uncharacterized protein n=1 Tax=Commensalibacter oyaizuii TaxID=3043873 RepID=A0ABT6Q3Z6_9PROT|nr:hypothetical protein [Commensalibacter sp. TBRC 16381]MDI2091851.1 hypothetical protein [Commensalibacter sp. TBRC 16381]